MINLLSGERKDEIRAARTNVILLRYMSVVALAFLFITAALYVSHIVLTSTKTSAEAIIMNNDVKADVYSETKQQVDTLTTQLSEARAISEQEVLYSQLLVRLGEIMPAGTVLGDTTFNTASFNGTPVDLVAYAKTTNEVTLIQSQFQASGMFSQVSLKGTEADKGIPGYPVSVSLSVVMNRARL